MDLFAGLDVSLDETSTCIVDADGKIIRESRVVATRLVEDHLFGPSAEVGSNAVQVYVHRLREQLADAGAKVQVTVRGVRYIMIGEK